MVPAFVLHRWPYQDTGLLVELITADQGRFRVIAKGAKRPKSPWRSILQPFVPLHITSQGRHELQTLTAAEATAAAIPLRGQAFYSGFYVNELVQRLTTPYHLVDGLFDDYQQTIHGLALTDSIEPLLRRFEWQLLNHLGHGFDWFTDVNQQQIAAEQWYQFIPEAGFMPNNEGTTSTGLVLRGEDIMQLTDFSVTDKRLLNILKRLMRAALSPYLGEQPLRSRQLFLQLKDIS